MVLGKYDEIPDQFFKILEKSEPCLHIYFLWSSAIVRTCQHKIIINECVRIMHITVDLEPSINNKLELAYQTYLSGQYNESLRLYSDLTNEEEPLPKAIEGIILCHIAMNDIDVQVYSFYKLSYLFKRKNSYD